MKHLLSLSTIRKLLFSKNCIKHIERSNTYCSFEHSCLDYMHVLIKLMLPDVQLSFVGFLPDQTLRKVTLTSKAARQTKRGRLVNKPIIASVSFRSNYSPNQNVKDIAWETR